MITIKPFTGAIYRIEFDGNEMDVWHDDVVDTLKNLKKAGHETEVILKANGLRVHADVQSKALELADLDGLQAAKQISTGKVVF